MKNQQLIYLSPRVAILQVDKNNKQKLLQAELTLKTLHKGYFHIFNLSSYEFGESRLGSVSSTNFKWREIPYSITEAIKLLACIESYQVKNQANAAILAVAQGNCYRFAIFVMEIYWMLLGDRLGLCRNGHALGEFQKIYKIIDIKSPPVKIIDSFSFKFPESAFIPIVKIYTESRHNYFEQVHTHNPQSQLAKFYIDRKSPLTEGIGQKYCEKQPQTKHFSKPVLVFGDVKIEIYSYTSLKLQKQFTCGFNTKCLQYDQSLIQLQIQDLYQVANPQKLSKGQRIIIEISDYCQTCKDRAACSECMEIVKKLGNTYAIAQVELEKLNRNRDGGMSKRILG